MLMLFSSLRTFTLKFVCCLLYNEHHGDYDFHCGTYDLDYICTSSSIFDSSAYFHHIYDSDVNYLKTELYANYDYLFIVKFVNAFLDSAIYWVRRPTPGLLRDSALHSHPRLNIRPLYWCCWLCRRQG